MVPAPRAARARGCTRACVRVGSSREVVRRLDKRGGMRLLALVLLAAHAVRSENACWKARALGRAARSGDIDIIRRLLARGVSVNALSADKNGLERAAIVHAAKAGHADAIRALAEAGADVEIIDEVGVPALAIAASKGNTLAVEALLEAGAMIASRDPELRKSMLPLHVAAAEGHAGATSALLKATADVNMRDGNGLTALMLASKEGHVDTVRVLLAGGADPSVVSSSGGWWGGSTAEQFAKGFPQVKRLLKNAKNHVAGAKSKVKTPPAYQMSHDSDNIIDAQVDAQLEADASAAFASRGERKPPSDPTTNEAIRMDREATDRKKSRSTTKTADHSRSRGTHTEARGWLLGIGEWAMAIVCGCVLINRFELSLLGDDELVWECNLDGAWHSYSKETSQALEKAYKKLQASSASCSATTDCLRFQERGFEYCADFNRLKQVNLSSNTEREIRRRPANNSASLYVRIVFQLVLDSTTELLLFGLCEVKARAAACIDKLLNKAISTAHSDVQKNNGRPKTFYHGTSLASAHAIQRDGFRTDLSGTNAGALLGQGLYVTTTLEKALHYAKPKAAAGAIFTLDVELGKCYKVTDPTDPMRTTWSDSGYDSAWAPPGVLDAQGREENCIKDPQRQVHITAVTLGNTSQARHAGFALDAQGKLVKLEDNRR